MKWRGNRNGDEPWIIDYLLSVIFLLRLLHRLDEELEGALLVKDGVVRLEEGADEADEMHQQAQPMARPQKKEMSMMATASGEVALLELSQKSRFSP